MRIRRIVITILSLAMVFVPVGMGQAAPDKLGGGTHVVQWGENLASIADRYGTTVAAIVQANGLANADYIYIGQQLIIPTAGGMVGPQPAAPPGSPAASAGQGYTVRFGDTLTSIALRYGVTVNDLMAANGLRDSTIYIGQTLVVPGQGGGGMAAQMPGQSPVGQAQPPMAQQPPASLYAVRPGDTLSAIAYRFGVTVNDIMQYNKLYSSIIVPGQQLAIPYSYAAGFDRPAGTYYTVQRGDTLAGLALRYGTTVSAILQANNLSQSQFIFPGQELVIPGAMTQFASPSMMAGPPQNVMFPGGPAPMSNPPMTQSQLGQGALQQPGAAGTLPMSNPPMTQPQLSQGVPQQSSAAGAPLVAPVVPGQPGQIGAPTGAYQPPVAPMSPPALSGVIIDNAPMLDPGRSEPPELTQAWEGRLVSQTQPEDWRYPAVLRVNVGAAKGMQVTVTKLGSNSWSTTGFTGTKPEYGDGAVEFAPLNPGKHVVSLDGQGKGARMVVDIKPNSLTYVEFVRVRADTGPMS